MEKKLSIFKSEKTFQSLGKLSDENLLKRFNSKNELQVNADKISFILISRRIHPTKTFADVKFIVNS